MADSETSPGKIPVVESSVFKLIVQSAVPVLLGVLVTLAFSINSAQKAQGEKLSEVKGQLGVMAQQYTDIGGRLTKVESGVDDAGRKIGDLNGRVLVLESYRRK